MIRLSALAMLATLVCAVPAYANGGGPGEDRQVIWFGPLDPVPRHPDGQTVTGSPQYMALFRSDAAWQQAAKHVRIFLLYTQFIDRASDGDLRQVLSDLRRRGIAVALAQGGLTATPACGQGVEGMGAQSFAKRAARIKEAGGKLDYITLDEPFAFGSLYRGHNACQWSAEKVAGELHAFIAQAKQMFPDVIIGETEPLSGNRPTSPEPAISVSQIEEWLDSYKQVTGTSLAFFHLDVQWGKRPDWPEAAKELRNFCHARGIAFGLIYNGSRDASSDQQWINEAWDRVRRYEQEIGGYPEHAVFQSWTALPQTLLPESDPASFTYLLDQYAAGR